MTARYRQVYGIFMRVMAATLLGLYLVCMVDGVIVLCLYEDASGLGLMAVGVPLYMGGALALEEARETLAT